MDNTGEQDIVQPELMPEAEIEHFRKDSVGEGTCYDPGQMHGQETAPNSTADASPLAEPNEDHHPQEKVLDDHDDTSVPFPKGISDDEDDEALDCSRANGHLKNSSSDSKRSSQSSHDGSDLKGTPKAKRPCQSLCSVPGQSLFGDSSTSLFGGLSQENEHQKLDHDPAGQHEVEQGTEGQDDQHQIEDDDQMIEAKGPGQNIGSDMSSLSQQGQRDRSPSQRPFYLGFGLHSINRNNMSLRSSLALSEDSVIIPPDPKPVYDLRTNIDRKPAMTYIDTDNSGNFDPEEEERQRIQKMNKAKAAKATKAARLKKGKSKAPTKENILKCIVKLRFKAFGNVRNYTNDEDNWPDDWSNIDSDCERELDEYRAFFRRNTPDRERQYPIDDPNSEVDDLTGYPAARGCKTCRKHGQACSLVQGGAYPCDFCLEDDRTCEPIVPPTVKGGCKQCIEDGETCSYTEDPSQSACDHCSLFEYICEALPPEGYKANRIIIDDLIYGKDRPFASCTVCRTEGKRCSLKRKADKPPCKYCKKNHIGCNFFEVKKPPPTEKAAGKKKALGPTEGEAPEVAMPGQDYFTAEDLADLEMMDDCHMSREPTPETEMEDNLGHKGILTKIKTCFSHPIQFGGLEDVSDCNFCELPSFGFVGYFEREVHVIRWHDGNGFTEVGGGHAQHHGITSMCQTCALGRAQVLACASHHFVPMYQDEALPTFLDTFGELLENEEDPLHLQHQLQRWCSFCFTPALFACVERQPSLFAISEDDDDEIEGCGLRLCIACEVRLREEFGGEVSNMADAMDLEPKASEDDEDLSGHIVRADVGFLSQEGLLMRSLRQEAEEGNL